MILIKRNVEAIEINGSKWKMELDTGTAIFTMSEAEILNFCPNTNCKTTNATLITYTGQMLYPKGSAKVEFMYNNQISHETLIFIR